MAKAMLIMDMPSSCMGCNFLLCTENGKDYCQARETVKEVDLTKCDKPTWCPLREVPSKHEDGHTVKVAIENDCYDGFEYERAYCDGKDAGYNACIDEILGGME